MWKIVTTDLFDQWFCQLADDEQESLLVGIFKLEEFGPTLGRPDVDTLAGVETMKNLKELRVQHRGRPLRVLFAFDPIRQAVMLCGGDKSNDKRFYQKMIPLAELTFKNHLISLEKTNG